MDARSINTLPSILTRFQTVIPVFFVPILLSSLIYVFFLKNNAFSVVLGEFQEGGKFDILSIYDLNLEMFFPFSLLTLLLRIWIWT